VAPYLIRRGFLPAEALDQLKAFCIAHEGEFAPSTMRLGYDPAYRQSLALRDLRPVRPSLRQHILAIAPALIAELKVSQFEISHVELELVAHNDGAFYKRHIDLRVGVLDDRKSRRILSAVLYFHFPPQAYSGGALRLYGLPPSDAEGDHIDITPEDNMLLVFPSWAAHEVLPVACPSRRFADSRFAVNCWIHRAEPGSGTAN
jgi:Rps23 Pro-64 3,4-dihydroxylase Tpa1-like proline 4-hydroxylase